MKIRKATPEDLEQLLPLYENARTFMASHGNPSQWGTSYPPKSLVQSDIHSGCSFVCTDCNKIIAAFYYQYGPDSTYTKIRHGAWLNDRPYGVVHRIVSDGSVKGTGAFCLTWALKQCGNLKIDTHKDNFVMQNLLKKLGFSQCGIIISDDETERLAYQKTL